MTRWDDQFEANAVFPALEQTRSQLEAVTEQLADTAQAESHARLVRVVDYIDGRLKAADPELVQVAVLDQMSNTLNQITSYLQQFAAAPDPSWLDNANGQADAVLQQAQTLAPPVTTSEDVQELQSAVSSFRRSAGQYLRNIESEAGDVQARMSAIGNQLTEQEEKIQAQDARLDAVVTDYQSQFSTAEAQRQSEFSQVVAEGRSQVRAAVDESEEALKSATSAAQERVNELQEQTKQASETRIKELDELLAKAVKTVGAIGSTGMAGGYKIVADSEKKAANIWRVVTAVALLGAIAATIYAVRHGVNNNFQVDHFFARWAVSIPFAALAGYAAHESSKHREQATLNRKIELQLASLDTYLVSLPQEKQDEIKAKLADRFFGELGQIVVNERGELDAPN